jgi:DnaJ-class molecular chaperone
MSDYAPIECTTCRGSRAKPSTITTSLEVCPACNGSGLQDPEWRRFYAVAFSQQEQAAIVERMSYLKRW